jgi:hypothetical protein
MAKVKVTVFYPAAFASLAPDAVAGDVVEIDESYVAGLVEQGWAEVVSRAKVTKK